MSTEDAAATAPTRDGAETSLRDTIARSWRRARRSGLDPAAPAFTTQIGDVDLGSSLLTAAAPVLDELERGLLGSDYATLLVDRDCRLVRRWSDDARIATDFDAVNIALGASLVEENIGTNALGTVMVTQQSIAISGREHFADSLKKFSCYGHPIRHPVTRRVEGALDITALLDTANPLLPPLISRAVADIEQRILDGSRTSEKRLLDAFQGAAGVQHRPVLAVGDDIVLSNRAANDLLGPTDVALLRALAEEPPHREHGSFELVLESGTAVSIVVSRVAGTRGGAVLQIDRVAGPRGHAMRRRARDRHETARAPLHITGVPGTGRTTRAREAAAPHPPLTLLTPGAALLDGGTEWVDEFRRALRHSEGTVCVDGIDLLPDPLLDLVIEAVDRDRRPGLIFVSGPRDELRGRAATLAGMATTHDEITPLKARRHEIPALASAMLADVAPDRDVHLAPSLIEALAGYPWPGNLRELKAVVRHLAAQHETGGLTAADLPEAYRSATTDGPAELGALDQAERDVILSVLQSVGGNKVRAAKALGISRTTLYGRMRRLRITRY
ncbi:sigma-54-dependent Fis family transcriptional regulator [Patulibacter sp. S7RM1-6]